MTGEFWAIIAVGVTLASLLIGLVAWLRSDVKDLARALGRVDERVSGKIEAGDERLSAKIEKLSGKIEALSTRVGRIEGHLLGLEQEAS